MQPGSTQRQFRSHILSRAQITETFNERPLFLLMNSTPDDDARDIPIVIHEQELHIVSATANAFDSLTR